MRLLQFVERDTEAGHIVLSTSDGLERFELPVGDALREAVRPAPAPFTPVGTTAVRSPSDPRISPREIQMRVRAGESAQHLADEYETSLDWVMRFARPVLGERMRITDESRRAKARRSTTEGQAVVFGDAVDSRFAAHGIDPAGVRWDAYRRHDAQWIITAHWAGGQSDGAAEWAFNLAGRTVAPADDIAADLLSDRPIPPPVAPGLALAPPLESDVVAFPAMPDAHTGPLPRAEELFDQAKFEPTAPPADDPQLPMQVPEKRPAPPARGRVPKVTNLGVATRDESGHRAAPAGRPAVPSWDDILLGVRRKQD